MGGALVCVFIASASFVSFAGASAPAPSCNPAHSKTLAVSKTARVFETRRGVYGCLFRYGRARRLDPASPRADIERQATKPFRLSGPYVAYSVEVSQGCGPDVCFWTEVEVADLRPSHPLVLHKHYAASDETLTAYRRNVSDGLNAEAFVTDLALTPAGAVAWIECEGFTNGPCMKSSPEKNQVSVFAAKPGARARSKLDEGAGVELQSLGWSGGRFRWRNGGQPRSAAP